jgi:hypothetical protein
VATRASGAAAVLGAGLLVVLAVRPLPGVPSVAPRALPAVGNGAVDGAAVAADDAAALAAELADRHVFSPYRMPLDRRPASAVAEADEGASDDAVAEAPADDDAVSAAGDGSAEQVVVELDDPEALAADVKASFESITLRGLTTTREGELRAMLSFVHAPKARPVSLASGSTFEAPRASNASGPAMEWRLDAIDEGRDRVLVSHGGRSLALALFPTREALESPFELAGVEAEVEAGSPEPADGPRETLAADGTRVVEQDARSIARELREAGHEADIEDIFRAMGMAAEAQQRADDGEGAEGDDEDGNGDGGEAG